MESCRCAQTANGKRSVAPKCGDGLQRRAGRVQSRSRTTCLAQPLLPTLFSAPATKAAMYTWQHKPTAHLPYLQPHTHTHNICNHTPTDAPARANSHPHTTTHTRTTFATIHPHMHPQVTTRTRTPTHAPTTSYMRAPQPCTFNKASHARGPGLAGLAPYAPPRTYARTKPSLAYMQADRAISHDKFARPHHSQQETNCEVTAIVHP